MNNQFSDLFHPYQLSKLIVDFDKGTVIAEAISEIGMTQIDLCQLAHADIDDDEVLAKFFDSGDLQAIRSLGFCTSGTFCERPHHRPCRECPRHASTASDGPSGRSGAIAPSWRSSCRGDP